MMHSAPLDSSWIWVFVALTVLTARCLYRIVTHPLAAIPGPLLGRITNARFLYHAWKGDLHLDHLHCHEEYGPVYRSGPNRVVFNTMTAVHAIYSNDRTIRKSDGYQSHPWTRQKIPSLFNCVDSAWAARKKKTIRPATAQPALEIHHASVESNVEVLANIVRDGKPHDLSQIAFYYALDVISQSMFGEKFQTMQDPTHRWMTESLERGNRHMYLQLAWPSLFRIIGYFMEAERLSYPQFREESKQFLDLCEYCLAQAKSKEKRSIFALMKADLPDDVNDDELHVDVYSLMRGGGDMVAVTIAAAFFYITQNQQILQKVQDEVRSVFTSKPPTIGAELESCAYLRACVDEALRMAPPGPGVFWRTSSSDLIIDGVFIPAGVEFGASIYAVHYNSEVFDKSEEFRPERMMLNGEKGSAQREGLIPFLRGFRACPAQKMAHATILLSLARLFWEFELDSTISGIDQRGEEIPITTTKNAQRLFPQVDVFGSRIEGPVLSFRPRV